jgi:hypothetical protein
MVRTVQQQHSTQPGPRSCQGGRGDLLSVNCDGAVFRIGKILSVYTHGTLADGTAYETRELDLDKTVQRQRHLRRRRRPQIWSWVRLASGPLVPDKTNSPHGQPWWTRAAFVMGRIC